MIAVIVFFLIFGGVNFLKPAGIASWLNVAANIGIIAIPVGLLMIAGELDFYTRPETESQIRANFTVVS